MKELKNGKSYAHLAKKYGISKQAIADLSNLFDKTGCVTPREGTRGPMTNKLTPFKEWIQRSVQENPDWSLRQLGDQLKKCHDVTVNRVSLWRFMRRENILFPNTR